MVDVQTIGVLVTAASVSVAAIYYMFTLRINMRTQQIAAKNQEQTLETRQAQLFMQVFDRYHNEEFWRAYFSAISKEYKDYEDWLSERSDIATAAMRLSVGTYFEGIGVLVRRGLLPIDLVADILGGTVVGYWKKVSEFVQEHRVRANYPQYLEETEYLYSEILKLRSPGFSPTMYYRSSSSSVESRR